MQASLPRWRPGICMEILSARRRASTIGCGFVDDAAVQANRDHTIVAQPPDPPLWIPRYTGLLHPFAECHVGKGHTEPDDLVVCEARRWRFPIAFGDDELHGFEPLPPLRIVAIAHADEAVTVLGEELLCALLSWIEMETYPRRGRLGRALGWCGAGRGSGGAWLVDRGRRSAP